MRVDVIYLTMLITAISFVVVFLFNGAKRLLSKGTAQGSEKPSRISIHSRTHEVDMRDPLFARRGIADLADLPEIWEPDRLATFFEECSREFPGRQTICLPLEIVGSFLVSAPQQKAALRLIGMLRQADHVILSIRALVGSRQVSDSKLTTIVLD